MPQNPTVLEVFLASPSDVAEERVLLGEVIDEFNLVWGNSNNVRLELIKWETHTRPGFGEDGQDVVNRQIGDSYNIFIGMMWGRFGSLTGRAESGTEEEFDRAFARLKRGDSNLQIMFYFKDAPLAPSRIDAVQLAKINSFKEKISTEYGGLYHQFVTPEDFRKLIRIHLSKLVQDSLKILPRIEVSVRPAKISALSVGPLANLNALSDDEEQDGILELSDEATNAMEKAAEIIGHINASMVDLGNNVQSRARELERLKSEGLLPSNSLAKRLVDAIADDLELYVQRMSVDLPALQAQYSVAMEKFGKMVMLSGADLNEATQDIERTRSSLQSSREAISSAMPTVEELRDAIAQTPRMTTAYRRAQRRAVAITDDFIAFMKSGISQTTEVEQVLQIVLDNRR